MKTAVKRKKAKTLSMENKKDAFAFAGLVFSPDLLFQAAQLKLCFSAAGLFFSCGVAFQPLRFSAAKFFSCWAFLLLPLIRVSGLMS